MQKITPFLWFNTEAEEAANFYTGIFPDSAITGSMPGPDGRPLTVGFRLGSQEYTALNGGPQFKPNEALSFVIHCKDQQEIDHYWNALTADGGQESQCGWLKDKYGFSWQVTPDRMITLMTSPDRAAAGRAMQAMMTMKKIDLAAIEAAYNGG